MGAENVSFDAGVIAAVGVVLGVAYVLGAMLAFLSNGESSVLLLGGSVPVTTTIGATLLLTGGLLGAGYWPGRYVGVWVFGAVVVFGRPSVPSPEPFPAVQAGLAFLIALYLVFRNPVAAPERSNVDESTSATKVGSTIR